MNARHPDALHLLLGLLEQTPEERLTLEQVWQHPYMQDPELGVD